MPAGDGLFPVHPIPGQVSNPRGGLLEQRSQQYQTGKMIGSIITYLA